MKDVSIVTSFKRGTYEDIILKPVYLRDNIDKLLALGRHIVINPFSDADIQFVIPYAAIQKMLKPLIDVN